MIRVKDLPAPSRFMFWCTAPFLVATIVLLPVLARPPELVGWLVVAFVSLLSICMLLGFWDGRRFRWCWRIFGGLIAGGYLAYVIAMIFEGKWFNNGDRSSSNAINAVVGFIVFGYPGLMYAVFGRLTWKPDPEEEHEGYADEYIVRHKRFWER